MKFKQFLITTAIVGSMFACSKSDDPQPEPIDPPGPIDPPELVRDTVAVTVDRTALGLTTLFYDDNDVVNGYEVSSAYDFTEFNRFVTTEDANEAIGTCTLKFSMDLPMDFGAIGGYTNANATLTVEANKGKGLFYSETMEAADLIGKDIKMDELSEVINKITIELAANSNEIFYLETPKTDDLAKNSQGHKETYFPHIKESINELLSTGENVMTVTNAQGEKRVVTDANDIRLVSLNDPDGDTHLEVTSVRLLKEVKGTYATPTIGKYKKDGSDSKIVVTHLIP